MSGILVSVTGGVLVLAAVRDIFRTVLRPGESGGISRSLMRAGWRSLRLPARRWPRTLDVAGPLLFLTAIGTWLVVLALGWALVYWPSMPEGFLLATGLPPAGAAFVDAVYVSLVTLAALGYGDISPREEWLRLVAPLESMTGLVLFSATIWWLLSIHPVLGRQRSFARTVLLQRESTGHGLEPEIAPHRLAELADGLVEIRNDLVQLPESYYFHAGGRSQSSLALVLPYLLQLAHEHERRPPPTSAAARHLRLALEDLARTLGRLVPAVRTEDPGDVFAAYAADHRVKPPRPDD